MRASVSGPAMFALLLCLAVPFAPAFGQVDSRPFYLSLSAGLCKPALGDVNDYLDSMEEIFESSLGQHVSWDSFGTSPAFSAELGKQVSGSAFFGARVTYQKKTVNNSYSNSLGSLSYDPEYQVLDISARLKFLLPRATGIYLGLSGGYAEGKFKEYLAARFPYNPEDNVTVESEYTGSGLSVGGFAGYQFAIGPKAYLTGELDYRYRNLGSFDGSTVSPEYDPYEGPALDNSGKEMDFDFSGLSIDIGVVIQLGG